MFQVGDYIVMKRGAPYTYTKYKSTGVVVEIAGAEIKVEYDFLVEAHSSKNTFWVDACYCRLAKQPSPQDKVCAKIKQIEARWLKFQKKRGACHV